MSVPFDPAGFAQRQLDAYNARDLARFVAEYTDDVQVFALPDPQPVTVGKAAFAAHYRDHRFNRPGLHATLVQRMVVGNKVIDHEVVQGVPGAPLETAAIYEVTPAGISRVWFVRADSPPRSPARQQAMAPALRRAQPQDDAALQQMLELYQYELSDIWPQEADAAARYGYDLTRHRQGERFHAHVAQVGSQYAGFALVAPAAVTRREGHWMEQFFVLRRYRRSGVGSALATHVLRSHPGPWEVGQLHANRAAQAFWRRLIDTVTHGQWVELALHEGWWQGVVQQFEVPAT